jgi:hypothetical protein
MDDFLREVGWYSRCKAGILKFVHSYTKDYAMITSWRILDI